MNVIKPVSYRFFRLHELKIECAVLFATDREMCKLLLKNGSYAFDRNGHPIETKDYRLKFMLRAAQRDQADQVPPANSPGMIALETLLVACQLEELRDNLVKNGIHDVRTLSMLMLHWDQSKFADLMTDQQFRQLEAMCGGFKKIKFKREAENDLILNARQYLEYIQRKLRFWNPIQLKLNLQPFVNRPYLEHLIKTISDAEKAFTELAKSTHIQGTVEIEDFCM
ncbi:hypothetical protein ACOME3_006505 [Neoechinorhynchus agilis]